MLLDYIKGCLKDKWNEYDGHPEYLSKNVSFNQIFHPVEKELYEEVGRKLGIAFPQELLTLYTECNGFRLFLSGFSIFGIQQGKGEMEPYDLIIENHNIHSRMKENGCDDSNLIFVGNYGRNYVFCIRKDGSSGFYMMENGKDSVIAHFSSLEELIRYFIPRMIEHYDDQYICDQPKEKYKMIPVLSNALYDLSAVGL